MSELMGLGSLVGWGALTTLLLRLALDLAFVTVVTRVVYLRLYRSREHIFTCHLFNLVTLCLCLLLREGSAGFGLALFGVFGILRYRTEQIRSRDLTYLFIVIGIGIINGVAGAHVSLSELLVVNAVIVGMTVLLELGNTPEDSTPILYDHLALLQPGKETALIADIAARTGLTVMRVETQRIDLLRDAAEITVYFQPRHVQ